MTRKKSDNSLTFEEAIEELEGIIEKIEAGETGLENAIKQFERGTELIKRCRGILDSAEKRIAELVQNPEGELEVMADDEVEVEEDESE